MPLLFAQLVAHFGVVGERHQNALRKRLAELVGAGRLLRNRRDEYCLLARLEAVSGVVSAHRDGFGFVLTHDGSADIYLPASEMRQLLDGDTVAVHVEGRGPRGRRAGTVVEVLVRGKTHVVGRYHREHGVGYVIEGSRSAGHFIVPDHYRGDAQPGQFVKLEILTYPSATREAQGRVVLILGSPEEDPAIATDIALEMFGLPTHWPADVRRAAHEWGDEVRAADHGDRVDLRSMPLVTIDGADARDFDDAVYAEPAGSGWRLVVAIADVSHYVRPHDALDLEAGRRGTSAYFPDRVVPMLPEQLSNGLCSLNPGVDRLCMVCDMQVGAHGKVQGARFYRAIMRSRQRLIYEEVQAAHDGDAGARERLHGVLGVLDHLYAVYGAFTSQRRSRGALDLDMPESCIELGSDGRIESIRLRERTDAHRLIEECMIAANVEAARFLRRHRLPTLFRVHAGPDEEKFENLRLMLQELGVKVTDQARLRPRELNRILVSLRERPQYPVLATAVLRTMAQAVYQPANIGHFGLALTAYTHFTSPIRRYPDLLVHRGIAALIEQARGGYAYDMEMMDTHGRLSSARERRAEEAARHVEARYKCAWAKERVGTVADGVVTAVTRFGLFVMLSDLGVDGLVHVTSLQNDYYHLQHGGLRLTGERTGASYGLGDQLKVRILRVEVDEAKIDLALVTADENGAERPQAGRRRAGRRGMRRY